MPHDKLKCLPVSSNISKYIPWLKPVTVPPTEKARNTEENLSIQELFGAVKEKLRYDNQWDRGK